MKSANARRDGRRRLRWGTALFALVALLFALRTRATRNQLRAQEERRVLGDRLYVERAGPESAPALVFLPGLMATTAYWREAGALSLSGPSTRVLLLDELGFGRSPWPDGEYTLEDHLGALERTLAAQRAEPGIILIGHSFGALLAAEYAARHADTVGRVFLFGTPLFRDEAEARQRVGEMSALAGLTANGSSLARFVCWLHAAFPSAAARLAPKLRRDLPAVIAVDGALHTWQSAHGSLENVVLGHSIEPAIRRLGAKLTFVHGRRDSITPLARIREIADATGASVILTDDDHDSYWRDAIVILRRSLRHSASVATRKEGR